MQRFFDVLEHAAHDARAGLVAHEVQVHLGGRLEEAVDEHGVIR